MTKKENNILYAYLVAERYKRYMVVFDGNKELKAFEKIFNNLDELIEFVTIFSDYNSIPVQFYY